MGPYDHLQMELQTPISRVVTSVKAIYWGLLYLPPCTFIGISDFLENEDVEFEDVFPLAPGELTLLILIGLLRGGGSKGRGFPNVP